ncbi:hypothetical protein AMATHDRAFT_51682 [Amanita thiersii Skay4041]|uniref:G-protein coupled receptors family 1 profile domain-containing protein n=1 Tax=Amanita thiersii Skay4041 TaxID=703135 RepID=A0A2A9N699_9AGAR|nr:hypothetical protein AMATHDRAFT_51682 [Amanita thiersii Skay4041]
MALHVILMLCNLNKSDISRTKQCIILITVSLSSPITPNNETLPPPGLNYLLVVQPTLGLMMAELVGTAILVPLLIILLFFSTKQLRRKQIFTLNVISILLGLSTGISSTLVLRQGIINPTKPLTSVQYALLGYSILIIPIFVESILLFRLLVVYPYHAIPLCIFLMIFIPLGYIKVARVVNISLFAGHIFSLTKAGLSPIVAIQVGWTKESVFAKTAWFLQVIDNTTCSCLFLYKLNIPKILTNLRTVSNENETFNGSNTIRGIFWIAVSNFVFPVLLGIAQLIFVFHDPSFFHGIIMLVTNDYVSIVGVLLATVWSASGRWTDEHCPPAQRDCALSTIHFTIRNNNPITTTTLVSSVARASIENSRHSRSSTADVDPTHEKSMPSEVRDVSKVSSIL